MPTRTSCCRCGSSGPGCPRPTRDSRTELTYGTLRLQGYYDRVIELAARRAGDRHRSRASSTCCGSPATSCCRCGSRRTPPSTRRCRWRRTVGSNSATGFVNGVLRTITRSTRRRVARTGARRCDEPRRPACLPSIRIRSGCCVPSGSRWPPRVARRSWSRCSSSDNVAPRVSLTALPGKSTVDDLDAYPSPFSPVGATLDRGDPSRIPAVRAGDARVQDEGSQLAALALSQGAASRAWRDGGSTCAPGRAARRRCSRPKRRSAERPCRERAGSGAGAAGAQRSGSLRPCAGGARARRHDGRGVVSGRVRPDPARRTVHRPRRPAATARGPLAQAATRCRRSRRTSVRTAAFGSSGAEARRPAGLRHLFSAPRGDPRRGAVRGAEAGRRRDARRHPGRCSNAFTREPLDLPAASHVQLWPHRHGTDAMFIQLLQKAESSEPSVD